MTKPATRTSNDRKFIQLALSEAAKCQGEDDRKHPRVGAVAVKNGRVLATAHRGELEPGQHAEFTALEEKLDGASLVGATIYTTLEPCTSRNHPKVPCAHRLVERRVRRVVIGMLDPNEQICGRGLWHLRESGIETDLFPHEHMAAVEELNREFIRVHRSPLKLTADAESTVGLALADPPLPENDPEMDIINALFDAVEEHDFAAAEVALRGLQARRDNEVEKQRLQLLFWQLKVKHAQDDQSRKELLAACNSTPLGIFATELLAHLDRNAGNTRSATERLLLAANSIDDVDSKASIALKVAEFYSEVDDVTEASGVLRTVASLELSPMLRAQVLRALGDAATGPGRDIQKAAFLCRAASANPTGGNLFAAAYALSEAKLFGISAVHYELALRADPKDQGTRNNFGVALSNLSLAGMGVKQYRDAADAGHTLAMANLAEKYIAAGFYSEAEAEITRGRKAESPHENIGSGMMSLANARKEEERKWSEERKKALGQKRFFEELADTLMLPTAPEAFMGTWGLGGSHTALLSVAGASVEAVWEDSTMRARFQGTIVGQALIGSLEQWNSVWSRFDSKGFLSMILRRDGTLSGLAISPEGFVRTIEWTRLP